jgi:hypothetical protein
MREAVMARWREGLWLFDMKCWCSGRESRSREWREEE